MDVQFTAYEAFQRTTKPPHNLSVIVWDHCRITAKNHRGAVEKSHMDAFLKYDWHQGKERWGRLDKQVEYAINPGWKIWGEKELP